MRRALLAALLLVLAGHFSNLGVVWVDEAYGMAAGGQLLRGAALYRDVWFDKPPLYAWVTLAWGAAPGWPVRLAGAAFALLCCWLAGLAARRLWGEAEAAAAVLLTAFFLTFDFPWAVLPLAPDMLTVPFALAFAWAAAAKRPWLAGVAAGGALLASSKALLLFPLALVWTLDLRRSARTLAGLFVLPAAAVIVLAAGGALAEHWKQVWVWGFAYSRDTFVASPLAEGLKRTANWLGFHAALAIPAALYWWRERDGRSLRLALWLVAALASVAAGWRFFPRYYVVLLPVLVLAAARGLQLLGPRARAVVLALTLAAPLVRFGPAYVNVAADTLAGRPYRWRDLAMFEDSRTAVRVLERNARPGDTLFVWGYRPEIQALARMPAAARFLDSQPLTGVLADRHLTRSDATLPALAAANRGELARTSPSFIVDGLGPYNPALAIERYPELARWFSRYRLIGETGGTRIYRIAGR
jgi:hypothetical protein